MAFVSFFFQNLRQLQQQLHNRVNPYLICLIHSALILYKKKRFFKKRIMNFPQHTVLKEITIQKEAYLLLYCTSLEICHSGFVTILKFEKFILKLLQSSVFMHVFITYRFYLPWEIKFSLSKSSGLDSPSLFSVRKIHKSTFQQIEDISIVFLRRMWHKSARKIFCRSAAYSGLYKISSFNERE